LDRPRSPPIAPLADALTTTARSDSGAAASVDQAYGRDVLHLTVFQGYVKKLLGNQRVARFLSQKYPENLGEFRAILDAESLEG